MKTGAQIYGEIVKKELEQKYWDRWPHWFVRDNMQTSLMCFGFECGSGWDALLWELCLGIEKELNEPWYRKHLILGKRKIAKYWNEFIYKLSPPKKWIQGKGYSHDEYKDDIVGRIMYRLFKKEEKEGDFKAQTYNMRLQSGLKRLVWHPRPYFEIQQVKEKFGTLRFYTNYHHEAVEKLVSKACQKSAQTCEICGKPGKTRDNGWVSTQCAKHALENEYINAFDYAKEIASDG